MRGGTLRGLMVYGKGVKSSADPGESASEEVASNGELVTKRSVSIPRTPWSWRGGSNHESPVTREETRAPLAAAQRHPARRDPGRRAGRLPGARLPRPATPRCL